MISSEANCSVSFIGLLGSQQYLKANDTPTDDLDHKILGRMIKVAGSSTSLLS